jgi:hypothetical protein
MKTSARIIVAFTLTAAVLIVPAAIVHLITTIFGV